MSAHPVDIHVGQRLRLRRSMLGMSQHHLAQEIGITFQQIQKYERGVNRVGSSRLYDFSQILKVPVEYFFEGFAGSEDNDNPAVAILNEGGEAYEVRDMNSKETLALIRSYYKIKDGKLRRKILTLVKAMAAEEDSAEEEEIGNIG